MNSKPSLLASGLYNIGYTNLSNNIIQPISTLNTLNANIPTPPLINVPTNYTSPIKDINKIFVDIYYKYIIENVYSILIILMIFLFLYYKYCNKKDMENNNLNNENFSAIDNDDNEPFIRPVFNPHYPVAKQINYAIYPSGRIPLKISNGDIKYLGDPIIYE